MSENNPEYKNMWNNREIDTINFSVKGDLLLPYLVIAKLLGYTKENPDVSEDMIWLSKDGERMVLTKTGFVPVLTYSYMTLYKELKEDSDKHLWAIERMQQSNSNMKEELRMANEELKITKDTHSHLRELFELTKKEATALENQSNRVKSQLQNIIEGKNSPLMNMLKSQDAAVMKLEMIKNYLKQL